MKRFHREILVEFKKKHYDITARADEVCSPPFPVHYPAGEVCEIRGNEVLRLERKFLFLCATGILAAGLTFGGCEKKEEGESPSPTPSTQGGSPTPDTGGDLSPEKRMEPALTDEAKKLYQFEDLSEGETYARINVKEYGTITVKFFQNEAPLAVENFLTHAKDGYYNGVTFHRVIDDFMIQGGDPDGTGMGGESIWGENFADEFSGKLHPYRGALCMANTAKADTNGSQFFIVQADADSILQMKTLLDAEYEMTLKDYIKVGYDTDLTDEEVERYELYGGTPWLYEHHTVFGQVLEGYEVLDAIAGVQTDDNSRPLTSVVIDSIEVLEYSADK